MALPSHLEETVILDGKIQCIQPRRGFRLSVDALLLAWFALRGGAQTPFCELGAGSGIVSVLLARGGVSSGVAVELDDMMFECLGRTVACNALESRVVVHQYDLRELSNTLVPGSFGSVVTNPPYFPIGGGRVNATAADARARHEFTCTMADVLAAARFLLPGRGRLFLIYPAARLVECLGSLPEHKLVPTRLQMVHSRPARRASHFLLEAAKSEGPELVVENPLIVHDAETARYGGWYGELLGQIED